MFLMSERKILPVPAVFAAILYISTVANAAEDVNANQLLNDLSDTIGQLRQVEEEGQQILDRRESNKQDIAGLKALQGFEDTLTCMRVVWEMEDQ